jgi:hypothetical protein
MKTLAHNPKTKMSLAILIGDTLINKEVATIEKLKFETIAGPPA